MIRAAWSLLLATVGPVSRAAEVCAPATIDYDLLVQEIDVDTAVNLASGRIRDTDGDGAVGPSDRLVLAIDDDVKRVTSVVDVVAGHEWTVHTGWLSAHMRLADIDGRPGFEVVSTWTTPSDWAEHVDVWGQHVAVSHVTTVDWPERPDVGNLAGDAAVDLVFGARILDPLTGRVHRAGPPELRGPMTLADLDLDGRVEAIAATVEPYVGPGRIGLVGQDGQVHRACLTDARPPLAVAVGNLDQDDLGEFVVAAGSEVAVCDTDATPLRRFSGPEGMEPYLVGLGDLDGDGDPEILVAGRLGGKGRLVAFDHRLNVVWTFPTRREFVLIDLDRDGDHEVLTIHAAQVVILDGDGTQLGSVGLDEPMRSGGPVATDVDGDGLVEIVVASGPFEGQTYVLENAQGGFQVPEARDGWSGQGHHPGRLDPTVPDSSLDPFWREPGGNVWQGYSLCTRSR